MFLGSLIKLELCLPYRQWRLITCICPEVYISTYQDTKVWLAIKRYLHRLFSLPGHSKQSASKVLAQEYQCRHHNMVPHYGMATSWYGPQLRYVGIMIWPTSTECRHHDTAHQNGTSASWYDPPLRQESIMIWPTIMVRRHRGSIITVYWDHDMIRHYWMA